MQNSFCHGVFLGNEGKLAGFASVICELVTTYYLCDVIVDSQYRHQGLGKALVSYIEDQLQYSGLRGILLTRDAHGFYEQFGFTMHVETVVLLIK